MAFNYFSNEYQNPHVFTPCDIKITFPFAIIGGFAATTLNFYTKPKRKNIISLKVTSPTKR